MLLLPHRITPPLLAVALSSACTSPSASTSEGSSTGVADDSSTSADSSASVTASTTDTTGPTSTTTSSMTGNTLTTTDASSSSGPQGCAGDDECSDPANPVCIDQVCSPCESDAQCEAKDPAAPACRDDGQCVQCTASNDTGCDGTTPICDAAVNTCMGCSFHEQCPDSACRIATGECFDEADVHTVGAGMEYENFTDAATDLGGDMAVLRVASGVDFNEAIVLTGANTIWAIVDAEPDDMMVPLWARTSGNTSTLAIDSGAEVYISGISVSGNIGSTMFPGIAVDNASLYLDRARVVTNLGGGISLDSGAYALVRNSFVGGSNNHNAVTVSSSTIDVLYSTLGGQFGNSTALSCDTPATVNIRNSLWLSQDGGAYACDEANAASYSVSIDMLPGSNNVQIPIGEFDFTMDFGGYDSGNFLLNASAPADILTAAQWNSGDPLIDIDGDARPGVDGSGDVAGADIP